MAKRVQRPPAKAGGASQPPAAAAPDLGTGLNKYFTPGLQALTAACSAPAPMPDVPNSVRVPKLVRQAGTRLRFLSAGETRAALAKPED